MSEEEIKKMYFDPNLPKNFFDKEILTPDFYKPENYELEITTHNSIRNMLFYQTTSRVRILWTYFYINNIEYRYLKEKKDYFMLKEVNDLNGNYLDRVIDSIRLNFLVII
jgi:hypothetical protein